MSGIDPFQQPLPDEDIETFNQYAKRTFINSIRISGYELNVLIEDCPVLKTCTKEEQSVAYLNLKINYLIERLENINP